MRKSYIILIIILISFSGLLSVKKKGPLPVKQDTLSLHLIPSVKHDLQITYVESQKLVFFIDNITIRKADLVSDEMRSFFINRAFKISKVTINDTEVHVTEYANLDAKNFTPRIRMQAIEEINDNCRMMEFNPIDLDLRTLPDTIIVKIKYDLTLIGDLPTIVQAPGRIDILANSFWYPRNLNQHENIHISMRSSDLSTFAFNDKEVVSNQNGYLRTAELSLVDEPDAPTKFSIISPGLK